MKKALVLLLVLTMLAPLCLIRPAKAAVEKQPFYALGWSDFDEEKYPYLDGLVTTSFSSIGENATFGGPGMMYGSYDDEDVTKVAQSVKEQMDKRPAGTRYWHVFGISKILKLAPDHSIFLEHGVTQLREMFAAVLKKMKEIDCPLDGVVIDTEYVGMGSWYLYTQSGGHSVDYYTKNKKIYAQIVKDSRYKTLIRPLLEERGFPFWPNPSGEKSEIFSICYVNKGEEYDHARDIWNTVMRIHLNNYANQWCYEPLKAYYPDASLSDYQSHDSDSWLKLAGITDDGVALSGGSGIKVGTASSFSYYYARPGSDFFSSHKQYVSFNDAEYEASAFNGLLYDVNFTRHMLSSTDTKQIAPWITSYMYGGKKASSMAYTPYYTELLYHLGMFDPEPFLSYTYVNEYAEEGQDPSYTSPKYLKTQKVMNEIMAALTEVAGYADRKPIEMPQYWNAEFVVSGMYANGRNIWRITPNTDVISPESFLHKSSDPTFSVKGQTITFPGGKILKDTAISEVGSCGYWVETPKDVMPVITADADRYAKYPSYEENFNSYDSGALTPEKMNQPYAWKYSLGADSAAKVTDKALALTGDVRFLNEVIPQKITAGDSYAEDQTWEMTVTVPNGLSADAEIHLLKYEGAGTHILDGGIKIKGGKVYYGKVVDNAAVEDTVLAEIKPGTYTLKRVMNFNNPDNFTYSVYLLDSKGQELASATDVSTPTFTGITGISFLTKKANKAVLVDDYKLYPSGFTTDFELYDADTGMNVKGDEAKNPRSKNTAFRLSWLNGTDEEKTVSVVAAIYEGSKLVSEKAVKTLKMLPGCDGVETGVVEVKSGQRVKVYLTGGAYAYEEEPEATEATKDATGDTKSSAPTQGATKATKATQAKLTKPTRATKATKVPTRASRETKATQPSQTKSPNETSAPQETLDITRQTLAPEETLAPEQSLAPEESAATQATGADTPDDTGKKAKGNTAVILIASAVGVLAVAGGVSAFMKKKFGKTAKTPETTEVPEELNEDIDE